ncbi:hypothetical protein [Sphaerisporangium rufum]|uniref:hypothetical protein n=1 Tax=Sphaerisporangium rufum TaxID=1381558 RepID=UPI0019500A4E|nr:hypothetical protein [Sphaerisporangium rufum]
MALALWLALTPAAACDREHTLEEAARILAEDGRGVMTFDPRENLRITDETGPAGTDPSRCPTGTARRSFRASGDFQTTDPAGAATMVDHSRLMYGLALIGRAYQEDDAAGLTHHGRSIRVFRRLFPPGITITLALEAARPNVELAGVTDCLPYRPPAESPTPSIY